MKRALSIAGSDPSGGAGIQADLKTFHQFGVYGMSALTLVTVQNTRGVTRVDPLDSTQAQIDACVSDIGVDAIKTGALGSFVPGPLPPVPLVIDPVMLSKHGASLLADVAALKAFIPRAALYTPNWPEAEALLGAPITDALVAARALFALGAPVLLKGGHAPGDADDLLFDGTAQWFRAARIDTVHTHGTGCTYSAAITAQLAHGFSLYDAVGSAKTFITRAIATAPQLGRGQGPVNHLADV